MSRSSKKGPYVDQKLLKKLSKIDKNVKYVVKTWSRASESSPEMVGYKLGVHNGRHFIEVMIKEEMVGHRLGEFSPTRTFARHGGKMQKDMEMRAAQAARDADKKEKVAS